VARAERRSTNRRINSVTDWFEALRAENSVDHMDFTKIQISRVWISIIVCAHVRGGLFALIGKSKKRYETRHQR
jgi:hypothetical protein